MRKCIFSALMVLYFFSNLIAQERTLIVEQTYSLSDLDSKITASAIAQNRAKDSLVLKIYRSLNPSLEAKSELLTNINRLSTDQVISVIPCIIEISMIKDVWLPDSYYIKLETSFDRALIMNRLKKISRINEEVERFERLKTRSDEANIQIETLKNSIDSTDFKDNKFQFQIDYVENINKLREEDLFQKGYLAFLKMEYDTAISYYNKMIELSPDNEFVYYNIALNYAELGNDDDAISYYKKTLKIDPSFAEANYNLGVLYAKQGNEYSANRYLQRAARFNHKKAKELLKPK